MKVYRTLDKLFDNS